MSKIGISKKAIVLLVFLCFSILFIYFLNADGNLMASNKSLLIQGKGMTVAQFQEKISRKDKLVMVYFNASWCVPCIKLKPVISELENDSKENCEILQINTDDNPQVAEHYEINSLPMFVLYKNGKKMWENIGSLSKTQLQSKIEMHSR